MRNVLCILTFVFCSHTIYAMGLGDWIHHTSNGTIIEDPGGGIRLWTNTNNRLSNLERWYFYKDHIIGEYNAFINTEYVTSYFILNELNGELKTYNNKQLFEQDILAKELEPKIRKRWYSEHIETIYIIYILGFVYWPLILFFILLSSALIYACIEMKNKILKTASILIAAILLLTFMLLILNDYYTVSI